MKNKTVMAAPLAAIALLCSPVSANAASPEAQCLAKVIQHEAGGESRRGQEAVAYVVLNRTKSKHFPKTVCSVVTQRKQFSGFSLNKRYTAATLAVAQKVLSSYHIGSDPSNGALFFRATYAGKPKGKRTVAVIGGHRFFK